MAKKNKSKKTAVKPTKDKIVNKGNWFMVQIVEQLEPADANRKDPERLCLVWANWHLIKAPNATKAYTKAEKLGRAGEYVFTNIDKQQMRWTFVGIGDLLPIYEHIEDKAELMWDDHGDIPAKKAKSFIPDKKRLLKNIKPMKK